MPKIRERSHGNRRAGLAFVLALTIGVGGCTDSPSARIDAPASRSTGALWATSIASEPYLVEASIPLLDVYDAPDVNSPSRAFENPWYYDAERRYSIPSVFYSDLQVDDWVRVLLPVRPNGSTGWVKASDVRVASANFRIDVDLSDHRLRLYDDTELVLDTLVAVGKRSTPTPTGKFYLRVLLQAPDPNTIYGPYAYGLSSHSEVLTHFNGDDAEIGIHGNNDASVLGSDITSGCIRMDNAEISRLAKLLPLGTPVDIHA